jgi:hypothetical protein
MNKMHMNLPHRILNIGLTLGLGLLASAAGAQTQQYVPTAPTPADLYCSGLITDKPVPNDMYVISGENSDIKTTFASGDFIFINQGLEHGVKVGDQFEVVRPIKDPSAATIWFKYQAMLSRAMGTRYADIARLQVIHVDAKTSTAITSLGCDPIQRGDLVRPFVVRPAPQYHSDKLDPFAPPSGKKTAMIVSAKDFTTLSSQGRIVYVNLGSEQGVRVGDYFRVFRYQGTRNETVYHVTDTAFKAYGFGSTPVAYTWDNLPRQVQGEGIVLRTGPNSSTVMLTTVRFDVLAGDYVELE